MKLKIFLKKFSIIIIFLVSPFLFFELALQLKMWVFKKDSYDIIMYRDLHHNINKYWNEGYGSKKIFWGPPYNVFLNRGEDDNNRLSLIHEKSIIPQTHNGMTANFLRPGASAKDSYYKVTINSLGFRDKERGPAKNKDTFRVIALGSYPTFGSGVNDEDTYCYQLEEILNRKHIKKVEVWNGGQQGTTAISGYARLVKELREYQPDLLIWDFGWVDLYFGQDFVEEEHKAEYFYPITQELARRLWRHGSFLLSSRHLYHLINSDFRDVLLEDWRRINRKMLEYTKEHNIKVVMLKQRVVIIPTEEYEIFAREFDHVKFINFQKYFRSQKISLTEDEENEFWSEGNWLKEGGFSRSTFTKDEYSFRVDAIMYNKFAHKRIATKLSDLLTEHIK